MTPPTFLLCAKAIIAKKGRRLDIGREFRSLFGVRPDVCSDLWKRCDLPPKTEPKHLLWALVFLKVYCSEGVACVIVGTSRKTYREWVWPILGAIAAEAAKHVVGWSSNICSLFFQPKSGNLTVWYLHHSLLRFAGKTDSVMIGTRYAWSRLMVPISIFTNRLHSVRSGFLISSRDWVCAMRLPFASKRAISCGSRDRSLVASGQISQSFRTFLKKRLARGEKIEADSTYRDPSVQHKISYACSQLI